MRSAPKYRHLPVVLNMRTTPLNSASIELQGALTPAPSRHDRTLHPIGGPKSAARDDRDALDCRRRDGVEIVLNFAGSRQSGSMEKHISTYNTIRYAAAATRGEKRSMKSLRRPSISDFRHPVRINNRMAATALTEAPPSVSTWSRDFPKRSNSALVRSRSCLCPGYSARARSESSAGP